MHPIQKDINFLLDNQVEKENCLEQRYISYELPKARYL